MKIYREYLESIMICFKQYSKKDKFKALLLTFSIGLFIFIPVLLLFINLFMQYLGIKYMVIIFILVISLLLHLYISVMFSLYYLCLNNIINFTHNFIYNKEETISFKKLFLAYFMDLTSILSILVIGIICCLIVNFSLF